MVPVASGTPCGMKMHGTIVLLVCTMGNSRVLNMLVPSKMGRNDVFIALFAKEGSPVECTIAYLPNKEIVVRKCYYHFKF